ALPLEDQPENTQCCFTARASLLYSFTPSNCKPNISKSSKTQSPSSPISDLSAQPYPKAPLTTALQPTTSSSTSGSTP
ncbi:hypothetical protein COCC4DRAFT_200600, partial [Bipolaris maydis ATCC 48331]